MNAVTTLKPKNPRFDVYLSGAMTDHRTMAVVGGEWRWRLIARNGEIIASGEGFTSKKDANRAVAAVKRAVLSIDANDACETVAPRASKARK